MNQKKSETWWYRLRHLKLSDNENNSDLSIAAPNVNLKINRSEEAINCATTRNSFRRSFRKMRLRMKSCVIKQKNQNIENSLHPTNIDSFQSFRIPSLNLDEETETPEVPVRRFWQPIPPICNVPKNEVLSLAKCSWYWGPATRAQAEGKLQNAPDGSFLVRDSSSDRYIFAISFRSVGRTLHTRIEYNSNGYSLFGHENYSNIKDLIEHALSVSKHEIYCYTKDRFNIPSFPVRLTVPVVRNSEVKSLKHLSRFVIRQCINLNDIKTLPLPTTVIDYLQEETIF